MLLNESVKDRSFVKGKVYVENRLVPVCNKPDCFRTKKEDLICALVSPNGQKSVMLDKTGEEYIVGLDDFHSELEYVNRDGKNVSVPKYLQTRSSIESFADAIGSFWENPTNSRRYKSWGFSEVIPVMNSGHGGATMSESIDLQFYSSDWNSINESIIEPIEAEINSDKIEEIELVNEDYGRALEIEAEGKKYKFVSKRFASDELCAFFKGKLKKAPKIAVNWLNENATCYSVEDGNDKYKPQINESYTVKGKVYKCVGRDRDGYYMQNTTGETVVMPKQVFESCAVIE